MLLSEAVHLKTDLVLFGVEVCIVSSFSSQSLDGVGILAFHICRVPLDILRIAPSFPGFWSVVL
jgi:hypothetical protein